MSIVIGQDNLLTDVAGTVTASSEATDFEKENAYNWSSGNWWKATAAGTNTLIYDAGASYDCDYFACYAHDLSDNSGSIELFYSDTGTSGPWISLFTAVSPTDTTPVFETFTLVNKRYFKVEVQDTGSASKLGVVSFGARMYFPEYMQPGFVPPSMAHNDSVMNSGSGMGAHIGREVRHRAVKFRLNPPATLTHSFLEGLWKTFIDTAILRPFFLDFLGDTAYVWSDGDPANVSYSSHLYGSVSLDCVGYSK